MFCPNEQAGMRQVGVPSHYGQQVIIDQCEACGGIWFDAFELFKVKLGEAQDIESLDSDRLRAPSDIDNPRLLCPRDRTALVQYKDPHFPSELILARCPKCQGFWLNRGEFTRYQETRQKMMHPKGKTPEDQKFGEEVKHFLQLNRGSSRTEALGKLGAYLSSPAHEHVLSPLGSGREFAEEGKPLDAILNVLMVLLRLFVLKS
ncbi:zf-TFIIB domain-containing protein [Pseudomonadota bacterium]